ncbi:hypothetical protein EMN47_00100 [Prolixibacteraceae bacterium JC049]|nr:hypothetical protein [Prolixibacteraceae bacterium JC049]
MKRELKSDKIIGKKLYNAEVEPPAFVWDNIEKELGSTKKVFPLWLKLSGVAAAIAIAFITGWTLNQQISQEKLTPTVVEADTPQEIMQPKNKVVVPNKEVEKVQQTVVELAPKTKTTVAVVKKTEPVKAKVASIVSEQKLPKVGWTAMASKFFKGLRADFEKEGLKLHDNALLNGTDSGNEFLSEQDKEIIKLNLAQLAPEKKKFKPYIQLGARFGASDKLSEGREKVDFATDNAFAPENQPRVSSDFKVSSSKGIAVNYQISRRLSVESGMYYSHFSQGTRGVNYSNAINALFSREQASLSQTPQQVSSKAQWQGIGAWGMVNISEIPSASTFYAANKDAVENVQNYFSNTQLDQEAEYIEVPMLLKYKMIDKKIDVNLLGGVSANFLVGNSVYINNNDDKKNVGKTEDLTDVTYSSTLGVGISYNVFSSFSLSLEPKLKYYLNSLTGSNSVGRKPLVMGVYAGISFQF